jgi:hypothetical protein
MFRICVAAWLAASAPALAADIDFERAKQLISERLTDPGSAQFRRLVHTGKQGKIICGEVNARNRLGGYDGFKVFFVSLAKTPAMVAFRGDPDLDGIFVEAVCVPLTAKQAPN